MWVIEQIIQWLNGASNWCYWARGIIVGWIWPFSQLYYPLDYLYSAFWYLAYYTGSFNIWVDAVVKQLSEVFSITQIVSFLQTWLDAAVIAYNWVRNSVTNVTNIVNDWWAYAESSLFVLISNLQAWAVGEINSLKQTVQAIVSDIEGYIAPILNSFRNTILILISDVKNWTVSLLNSLSYTFTVLISDVKSWATAQLNNARDFLAALLADLSNWTVAQINTLKDAISNLLDWNALWNWITGWWNDRLKDIQALFNSWIKNLSPFWEGWQDVRQSVIAFLNNPLEWLWVQFADWFLGKE